MIDGEPSLDELLEEPIVRLMMRADAVEVDQLLALVARLRERSRDDDP